MSWCQPTFDGLTVHRAAPSTGPVTRAFDPGWKDIQIRARPETLKRLSRESRIHVCRDRRARSEEVRVRLPRGSKGS